MGIKELRARIAELTATMRQLSAEIGDGEPTDEQVEQWTEAETEIGERQAELDTALTADSDEARAEARERVKASRARWGSLNTARQVNPFDGDAMRMSRTDVVERAQRLVDDTRFAGHLTPRQKEHVSSLVGRTDKNVRGEMIARMLVLTGAPEYRSGFAKLMAGREFMMTSEERAAFRAVDEYRTHMGLTDAAGGYAVPFIVDPTVILTGQGSPNEILNYCRVETITNDVWRGISSAGSSWAYKAEGAEFSAADPALGQPTVSTQIAGGWITYSFELEGDWPALASNLSTILSSGYRELLAEKLTTGSATSSEPVGIVTALAATTAGQAVKRELATAATLVAADMYGLWNALPAKWRAAAGCAFMSSTDVQNDMRQLGTVDPNFTVNITAEAIGRLFGKPYPTNDYMEDMPTGTGTQGLIIVGDWAQYLFAQRAGMTIERVTHVLGTTNNIPTGERGALAWARNGADAIVPTAFRMITNKSA